MNYENVKAGYEYDTDPTKRNITHYYPLNKALYHQLYVINLLTVEKFTTDINKQLHEIIINFLHNVEKKETCAKITVYINKEIADEIIQEYEVMLTRLYIFKVTNQLTPGIANCIELNDLDCVKKYNNDNIMIKNTYSFSVKYILWFYSLWNKYIEPSNKIIITPPHSNLAAVFLQKLHKEFSSL